MPQRKFHVTEALNTNQDVIHQIMESGSSPGVEPILGVDLPRPIRHRTGTFNHVTVERYQTSDSPSVSRPDDLVAFAPSISFKLLGDKTDEHGLVTEIGYAEFALAPAYFKDWYAPLAIGRFLLLQEFSVYYGEHSMASAQHNDPSVYPLGGRGEVTQHARLAAMTINGTCEAVLSVGFDYLMAQQQLLAERQRAAEQQQHAMVTVRPRY